MIATLPAVAEFVTKGGNRVTIHHRPGTTDWQTANACITFDEYGLAERSWEGVAVDVGAHIGAASVALMADNPGLTVIAVEALPNNADMIRRNLAQFGPAEGRWKVLNAAASCKADPARDERGWVTVAYGSGATPFESEHRFIGGAIWQDTGPAGEKVSVPAVSLSAIVGGNGPISLVKIDCEGCEWSFLDDPAVAEVAEIRGEYHPRDGYGPARVRELLEPTHVVTLDDTQPFGPFRAVRW